MSHTFFRMTSFHYTVLNRALVTTLRQRIGFLWLSFVIMAMAAVAADSPAGAYFEVDAQGGSGVERFVIFLVDQEAIDEARRIVSGEQTDRVSVMGKVVKAPAHYNEPWSFHMDPSSISFFSFAVEVCDAAPSYVEEHLDAVGGAFLPNSTWCPWGSRVRREIPPPDGSESAVRVVSAASQSEAAVAPGSLVSIYGSGMTDQTASATAPDLPLELAGLIVEVKAEGEPEGRRLPLLFASPEQVNAVVPADAPRGLVAVRVHHSNGQQRESATHLESPAPALFFVPHEDEHYAAATLLRVRPDGSTSTEALVALDPSSGDTVPVPVNFGQPDDQLYLSLYGSGLAGANASTVTARIGSETVGVMFAGPQGGMPGLDQINLPLPRSLSGQPNATIRIDAMNSSGNSVSANNVRILLQASAATPSGPQ